LAQRKDSAKV